MWTAILCFSVCVIVALTQRLDLEENDICKQEGDQLWSCKKLRRCPTALADRRKGKIPQQCNSIGGYNVVCCQPAARAQPRTLLEESPRKSQQKCKEYAKYVYHNQEDPMNSGEFIKIDTCALVEPLITNGTPAEPREYPHMALIGYGEKDSITWWCGGSLISERFVLSAAHCSHPVGSLGVARWVRLGDYDISSTTDNDNREAESREYEIIERINHPDYKSSSLYNDIALYKLKENVNLNEFVRPICLQTDHTFAKTYAIATGWGYTERGGRTTDILQKVNLTIIGRKECADPYKSLNDLQLENGIIDATQLCAGDMANGKDTCKGDSGGPIQIRLREPYCMYSQVGITSFGLTCAGNVPGVFTRVSHYVPWIESIVWP